MIDWSFIAFALGAILYIELGSRFVRMGIRVASRPIWPTVRVLLVLTWPLVLVYGIVKSAFR